MRSFGAVHICYRQTDRHVLIATGHTLSTISLNRMTPKKVLAVGVLLLVMLGKKLHVHGP